jgi:hypothetical protein
MLISFYVFGRILRIAPVLARFWFMDLTNRATTTFIEQLCEKYYSPYLTQLEIERIQGYDQKTLENTTFKVQQNGSSGMSVVTLYKIDEMSMEVILNIPCLYPLRQVTVDEGGKYE